MKKLKTYTALFLTCALLGACSGSGTVTPSPSPSPTPFGPMTEQPTEDSGKVNPDIPDSGYVFDLTEEENAVYEQLKAQLTTDVFEGVAPISVAKIYIMCGVEGEWEAEYICFAEEGREDTKEEWRSENERDIDREELATRQLVANWRFPLLKDGVFTEDGNKGCIDFYSVPTDETADKEEYAAEFHLLKNEKGIWEVRFWPFEAF